MASAGRVRKEDRPRSWAKGPSARNVSQGREPRLWKSRLFGILLAGLAFMVPQVSVAADNTKKLFQTLDLNGDKQIDRDEFNIQAMEIFYNTDKNKDGFLSKDEMLLSEAAFAALDRENKGKVSGLTFIDSELMDFDRIDSDGDGKITFDEFEALVKSVQKPG